MHYAFTEDQLMFRDAVRSALEREVTPERLRARWESEDTAADEAALWETLAGLGLLGMMAPTARGGLGMSLLDVTLLLEETGRVALPAPLVATSVMAAPLLAEVPEAAERWLKPLIGGDAIVAVGLASGSPWVADADRAAVALLEADGALHAVPRDALELTPEVSVDRSRRLFRVGWTPTEATRIADGEEARRLTAAAFNRGLVATSAQLIGLSRRMLEVTVAYASERTQFSRPIGSFQAVKHHLADALIRQEFAAPVVHRAAHSLSRPGADPETLDAHASHAFIAASEAARLVARKALQCHGAMGYSYEVDLHLWMKRAWALSASWGSPGWHLDRVEALALRDP